MDKQVIRAVIKVASRVAGAVVVVCVITWLGFAVFRVNAATVGVAYLVTVLLLASFAGTAETLAASILAAVTYNYFFLPPVFAFTIADPQNWVALFALLTTALVGSRLAQRARDQSSRLLQKQREMELLYAFSRTILLAEPGEAMTRNLAFDLARIFELPAVVLFDRQANLVIAAGPDEMPHDWLEPRLREAAVTGVTFQDLKLGNEIFAVRLGGDPIGSVAVRGLAVSEAAQASLLNLIAIALERVRGQERASRAAAERQSELLKSTLLDAMAHEFKTPLTSIKAASSSLLLNPAAPRDRVTEIGSIVAEEASRLENLVTEAIQMARIEPGKLRMNRRVTMISEIVDEAIRRSTTALDGHHVAVELENPHDTLDADPELIELALHHLLDNAAKYSSLGSPIEISAHRRPGSFLIEVRDFGAGIPEHQQDAIFEKFYRAPQTSGSASGTGMGLSIVREIVKAHGGKAWVESNPGEGARFSFTIPVATQSVS